MSDKVSPSWLLGELFKLDGFLVGSRAWGGWTAVSDHDVALPCSSRGAVTSLLTSRGIELTIGSAHAEAVAEDYAPTSAYVDLGYPGGLINLVFLGDRTYEAWRVSSQLMKALPQIVRRDRLRRRYLFTLLVDALRHLPGELHDAED
jgi:hypothetical protein